MVKMKKILWWLIAGTRGGNNRVKIIRAIKEEPMNANQLSKELNLDYKTIKHHLKLLEENDVLTTMGDGYGKTYFLSERMEKEYKVLKEIIKKTDIGD